MVASFRVTNYDFFCARVDLLDPCGGYSREVPPELSSRSSSLDLLSDEGETILRFQKYPPRYGSMKLISRLVLVADFVRGR